MSVLDMFSLTAICAVTSAIRLEDALITVGSIPLDDTGLPVSPRLCCDVVHLSACSNAWQQGDTEITLSSEERRCMTTSAPANTYQLMLLMEHRQ